MLAAAAKKQPDNISEVLKAKAYLGKIRNINVNQNNSNNSLSNILQNKSEFLGY